jgi:hypothetical protein
MLRITAKGNFGRIDRPVRYEQGGFFVPSGCNGKRGAENGRNAQRQAKVLGHSPRTGRLHSMCTVAIPPRGYCLMRVFCDVVVPFERKSRRREFQVDILLLYRNAMQTIL